MHAEDSGELLRRCRSGDRDALILLAQRHWAGLRAFARARMSPMLRAHESGSDLVQATVMQLLQNLDGFEYRGEEAFRTWLYSALQNQLRNYERDARAQKRDVRRQVELPDTSQGLSLAHCYSQVLSPSGVLITDEQVRAFEAAMDTLPDNYQEVIALSRLARLSRRRGSRSGTRPA